MFTWYGVKCHLYYFLSMVRLFLFHLTSYQVESGEFSVRRYAFSGYTCQSVQKTAVKMSDLFIYFLLWSSLLKVGIKICTASLFVFFKSVSHNISESSNSSSSYRIHFHLLTNSCRIKNLEQIQKLAQKQASQIYS